MPRVSNFAPELIELYRRCAQESILIELPTRQDAITFRHRMHSLRVAMRQEQHPLLPIAESVTVRAARQNPQKGTWYVLVEPQDATFLDSVRRAGINVDEPPADAGGSPSEPDAPGTATQKAVESWLTMG